MAWECSLFCIEKHFPTIWHSYILERMNGKGVLSFHPFIKCMWEQSIPIIILIYNIKSWFNQILELKLQLTWLRCIWKLQTLSGLWLVTCVAPDCGESYVGKTKQSLKARLNQHHHPSTNEAQNSAVYNHSKASIHSFKPEEAVILDKEARWFERGIQEAVWEWVEHPSLTKKGGAFTFKCLKFPDTT